MTFHDLFFNVSIALSATSRAFNTFCTVFGYLYCTLFKLGCLERIYPHEFRSFLHPVLHLCLFSLDLSILFVHNQPVSIDTEPWLLKLPFVLIKLLPELHNLCKSLPQTISSSAGRVCSAKLLLRHCAVKLPLLQFLNLFLTLLHFVIISL